MQVSLSDEAIADADDAVDWYIGEGAPAAADDFLNEVDHALDLLLNNPEMGRNSSHQTRILPLHSFPFSLVYRSQPHTLRVIAIAHHSRRPGYWAARR
jgi:plasmid stabilization system protein ParE